MLARPARVLVSLFALRALDAGVQARAVLPDDAAVVAKRSAFLYEYNRHPKPGDEALAAVVLDGSAGVK